MLLPSPILQKLPTRSNRDFETARRRLNGALWRIVTEYRANTAARDDLLSMLRDARDETGARMSDQQLFDKAMTMLLAGTETSAYPLCGRRRHHPRQRSLSSVDLCPDQGGTWIAGTVAGQATLWNLRSFPPPLGSMWWRHTLGQVEPGAETRVAAISGSGELIVGTAKLNNVSRAFIRENGAFSYLPGVQSWAIDVNDSGVVLAKLQLPDSDKFTPVLWR